MDKELRKYIFQSELMNDLFLERIEDELSFIEKYNITNYFKKAKALHLYLVSEGHSFGPGLGATNCSLINYMLGFTNINPLDFNLFFERYLDTEFTKPYFQLTINKGNISISKLKTGIEDYAKLFELSFFEKIVPNNLNQIESKCLKTAFSHPKVQEVYNELNNKELIYQENWIILLSKLLKISLNDSRILYRKVSKQQIKFSEFFSLCKVNHRFMKQLYEITPFIVCKSHIIGETVLKTYKN